MPVDVVGSLRGLMGKQVLPALQKTLLRNQSALADRHGGYREGDHGPSQLELKAPACG